MAHASLSYQITCTLSLKKRRDLSVANESRVSKSLAKNTRLLAFFGDVIRRHCMSIDLATINAQANVCIDSLQLYVGVVVCADVLERDIVAP